MKASSKISYISPYIFGILFFLSFSMNLFNVADKGILSGFDLEDEGLVIGRIEKSFRDGIFSAGGFPCAYLNGDNDKSIRESRVKQRANFVNNVPNEEPIQIYTSQSGGQGIMYSFLHKLLPLDNLIVLYIFRAINVVLISLCFILFLIWIRRNFSFCTVLVTGILLLLTPGLIYFGHNLWWALWSFYMPFIAMLLSLEYRHKNPVKMTYRKIFIILFFSVLFKCFFTGFEFITTTLIAALSPFIYYAYIEKQSWKNFIKIIVIAGCCGVLAVFTEMLFMLCQFKLLTGSFMDGINHIIYSFSKSSSIAIDMEDKPSLTNILMTYLNSGNMLQTYIPGVNIRTYTLLIPVFLFGLYIFFTLRKKAAEESRKYIALLLVTAFSLLAPLSWYIIFQEHATMHPFFDYIVLYIPFFLFGFMNIGNGLYIMVKNK